MASRQPKCWLALALLLIIGYCPEEINAQFCPAGYVTMNNAWGQPQPCPCPFNTFCVAAIGFPYGVCCRSTSTLPQPTNQPVSQPQTPAQTGAVQPTPNVQPAAVPAATTPPQVCSLAGSVPFIFNNQYYGCPTGQGCPGGNGCTGMFQGQRICCSIVNPQASVPPANPTIPAGTVPAGGAVPPAATPNALQPPLTAMQAELVGTRIQMSLKTCVTTYEEPLRQFCCTPVKTQRGAFALVTVASCVNEAALSGGMEFLTGGYFDLVMRQTCAALQCPKVM